ncbi:sodium:proton exchanger [archaeon]|jgi:Kef-type K+ transport system membrane component KefB/Trk K+ transport system NAD-binding subunit|nr:sodium:proton exchanger [archaeon]
MEVFIELSLIIVITVLIAGIMRLLKQPLIIGYILTGIIVSPYFLNIVKSTETISIFSQIGVTFLLFIVGISLSPKIIREVGKVSLITGIGQIIFTSLIGFFISKLLGFTTIVSIYIAIALTFSSTIIIMKLLSDKKDTEKLYGKISIGFLLVQDFFVIILLMIVSSFSNNSSFAELSFQTFIFGGLLIGGLILIIIYVLPRLSAFFAKSQEFLFLFSIGWGMGLAALFHYIGFSMEIGALVAGVALSMSPFNYEISSKLRPLRDFFIILFFILLGSQMVFGTLGQLIVPAIIFSLFILIGNPLIVMVLMGFLGYRKKTGFQAGFTVAQISEFSLILITLGVAVGHLTGEILSLVTIVGLITISGSTYLIMYSNKIYPYFSKYLNIFERKKLIKQEKESESHSLVLFGYKRIGYDLLKSFKKLRKKILVVDYNPETILELSKKEIECRYGDADDEEFLSELNLVKTKMIVSTIPEFETNLLLINTIRQINKDAILIVVSHNIKETNLLYEKGATYVIMPHFLGGRHASMMVDRCGLDLDKFLSEKKKHLKQLKTKKKLGHEHPKTEKHRR